MHLSSPLCFPRNLCIPSITVDFWRYLQGWKREQTYKKMNIHANKRPHRSKFKSLRQVELLYCYSMFCKKCKFWVNFPFKCFVLSTHSLHRIDLLSWYSLSTSLRRFFSRARASWLPQTSSALKVTPREKQWGKKINTPAATGICFGCWFVTNFASTSDRRNTVKASVSSCGLRLLIFRSCSRSLETHLGERQGHRLVRPHDNCWQTVWHQLMTNAQLLIKPGEFVVLVGLQAAQLLLSTVKVNRWTFSHICYFNWSKSEYMRHNMVEYSGKVTLV